MITYKVYYINLDKSIERREFMEKQFKELKMPNALISTMFGQDFDSK